MQQLPLNFERVSCAVQVSICVTYPVPSSRPKKLHGQPCIQYQDVDNIAKEMMDSLTGLVWVDDRQVSALYIEKNFAEAGDGEAPRVEMEITYHKEDQ